VCETVKRRPQPFRFGRRHPHFRRAICALFFNGVAVGPLYIAESGHWIKAGGPQGWQCAGAKRGASHDDDRRQQCEWIGWTNPCQERPEHHSSQGAQNSAHREAQAQGSGVMSDDEAYDRLAVWARERGVEPEGTRTSER